MYIIILVAVEYDGSCNYTYVQCGLFTLNNYSLMASFLGETEELLATVDDKVLSKCVTI